MFCIRLIGGAEARFPACGPPQTKGGIPDGWSKAFTSETRSPGRQGGAWAGAKDAPFRQLQYDDVTDGLRLPRNSGTVEAAALANKTA